jgi:hypothetical protein
LESGDADKPSRAVTIYVSVGGAPVGSFAYTVSESGRRELIGNLWARRRWCDSGGFDAVSRWSCDM